MNSPFDVDINIELIGGLAGAGTGVAIILCIFVVAVILMFTWMRKKKGKARKKEFNMKNELDYTKQNPMYALEKALN